MSVRSLRVLEFEANDQPSGLIDGNNKIFELSNDPLENTVIVYLNGLIQKLGSDYVLSGKQITFNQAPQIGSEIIANYFK